MPTQAETSTTAPQSGANSNSDLSQQSAPARLWLVVAAVAIQWAIVLGTAWFAPMTMTQWLGSMLGPAVALLLVIGWWLFASRLPWKERLAGSVLVAALIGVTFVFAHPSIGRTLAGGILTSLATVLPWTLTTAAVALFLSSKLPWTTRRWLPFAVFLVAAAVFLSLRFEGMEGDADLNYAARWTPTQEEVFLSKQESADSENQVMALQLPLEPSSTDWPSFRGPVRDGRLAGVSFPTEWKASPPRLRWRRAVGPGWSSFAVIGNTIFTQEQHGKNEVVVAYSADTGDLQWTNQVETRFDESLGGPGPRATPTYHQGRLYTQGANGKLHCLNASTGEAHWIRDLTVDTPAKPPTWGFASSPLIVGDLVITYTGAGEGQSVIAYNTADGTIAWKTGDSTHSYSSPHLTTIADIQQVLISSNAGLAALDPIKGTPLWKHEWDMGVSLYRTVQPLILGNHVLLGTGDGFGTQRITITRSAESWTTEVEWTSKHMKPEFNDYVHYDGYLYGFDGPIFACINLADGKREWKRGRYGSGQVLLLVDMGVLLIVGEAGELVLLEANPNKHVELAKIQALEGKTWNHPVISDNLLFLRNGQEAACYELSPAVPTEVAAR